jgi:hypothetical protein
VLAAACGTDDKTTPDAGPSCDPPAVLPGNYRLIDSTSTGTVSVTTTGGVTSGKIDARAGGINMAADSPYIYVDLKAGTKVEISDVAARASSAWDIALKRASLRTNSGDSGTGKRQVAAVQVAALADVTAAPASDYAIDDFTTDDCMFDFVGASEPRSAFGEWYDYDLATNRVTPKAEVYVIKRSDGSSTAFRITAYYDPPEGMTNGAMYSVEWKQL